LVVHSPHGTVACACEVATNAGNATITTVANANANAILLNMVISLRRSRNWLLRNRPFDTRIYSRRYLNKGIAIITAK
jgi:hypothetical protein